MPNVNQNFQYLIFTKYLLNVNLCMVKVVGQQNNSFKYFIQGLRPPEICLDLQARANNDGDIIISFNNDPVLLFNLRTEQMIIEDNANIVFYEPSSPIEMIDEWLGGMVRFNPAVDFSNL